MATLYGNADNFDTQKVLAAAEFGGKKITVKDELPPADKFITPARPALLEGARVLQGSLPISWHVADGKLRGENKGEDADVLCWINFAENVVRPAVMSWVLPATSCMPFDQKSFDAAHSDSERLLSAINDVLLNKTFLVGERLSLADIHLAFNILPAYQHVIEPAATQRYGNVTRWFMTIVNQPNVAKVVGKVVLCEKASAFNASTWATNAVNIAPVAAAADHGKKDKKKKEEKKEEKKPKADKKKKEKEEEEPAEEMDEAELAAAAEPKKKDPWAELEKGTFNMDEFKRTYSNEDTEKVAIPYFWDKLDKKNYSIWQCEYKYPQDLKMVFMSCNLMGGFMQRLDSMRKQAFASLILFGENNKSTIGGIFIWRGQGLAFELSPDWAVDYESYTWTKLDADAPSTVKTVNEYLMWEGDFGGRKFNQGKIFK
jgi:elongation factor 1-gamma